LAGGRPTKFKTEYAEQLVEHMGRGYSFESFGGAVKVCKQTLYSWCEAHDTFKQAKALGETLSQYWWEQQGHAGLYMGGKDTPFNATVWIFNMKNRFGWRDKKPEDDGDKPPGSPPQNTPMTLSPDDLVKLVQAARGEEKK
jgi:hypothetical protein